MYCSQLPSFFFPSSLHAVPFFHSNILLCVFLSSCISLLMLLILFLNSAYIYVWPSLYFSLLCSSLSHYNLFLILVFVSLLYRISSSSHLLILRSFLCLCFLLNLYNSYMPHSFFSTVVFHFVRSHSVL